MWAVLIEILLPNLELPNCGTDHLAVSRTLLRSCSPGTQDRAHPEHRKSGTLGEMVDLPALGATAEEELRDLISTAEKIICEARCSDFRFVANDIT
jgi:hypothetical protein